MATRSMSMAELRFRSEMTRQFIVMGVSGCGKSTLAEALAAAWSLPYIEGDELHGPANVAKMAGGMPLDDHDRWPWLDRIGAAIITENRGAVASCSALRVAYRDRLRTAVGPNLRFVLIDLPRSLLEQRMAERTGHYMPPALLDSQLRTLERPLNEPDVLLVDGIQPLARMVAAVGTWHF